MTTHNFKCLKCHLDFSIKSEQSDINKLAKELTIRCPKCGDRWGDPKSKIEYQMQPIDLNIKTTERLRAMRRENKEYSYIAKQKAMEYRKEHPEEFQQVTIKPPVQEQSKKNPLSVPKKVFNNIQEKVEKNIQNLT